MPGFVVQMGAKILCPHGGEVQIIPAGAQVTSGGMALVTTGATYVVKNCPQKPPVGPPCTTVTWQMGATKVMIKGVPALVKSSIGLCAPLNLPAVVAQTQAKVSAK